MFKTIIEAIKSTNETIKTEEVTLSLRDRVSLHKQDILLGIHDYLETRLFERNVRIGYTTLLRVYNRLDAYLFDLD